MLVGYTVKDDFTFVWLYRSGNRLDEGGLAGTVFTHQRVHLTLTETDGYIVQRYDAGISLGNIV